MRKIITCLLFVLVHHFASAQETSVKGTVKDTLEKRNLANAVVSLLQKKDSALYKFSRTNSNGSFIRKNIKLKNIILISIKINY